MKAKKARYYFLGLCLAIALMLILKFMSPMVGSLIFAGGLIVFGILSNGFRKK